jgi:transposase
MGELLELLHHAPVQDGIVRSRWRLQDMRAVLPALHGYSLGGISKLLVRLGVRSHRGRLAMHSPDPAYDEKCARLAAVAEQAAQHPDTTVLLYGDEFSLYRQPTLAACYAPIGQEPIARLSLRANRYHRYSGALNHQTGRVSWCDARAMRVPVLCTFLAQLRLDYPHQTLFLAWDNWPVHKHERVLATADLLEITLLWLPTYAPWTNPIEKLWRWSKQTLVHQHRLADHPETLQQQLATFLNQFHTGSEELLHYVGLLPN